MLLTVFDRILFVPTHTDIHSSCQQLLIFREKVQPLMQRGANQQ